MLAFYESIHGIYHDVTLPVVHNHWMEPLAEFVRLAVESTTTPPPVTVPKVADLRKKERWRTKMVDGATVVQYLHDRRGSNAQVWAGMFAILRRKEGRRLSQMHIDVAAAGASKDCDSPFDPAAPSTPAKTLRCLQSLQTKCSYWCSCGQPSICCRGEGSSGRNRVTAPLSFTAANYMM